MSEHYYTAAPASAHDERRRSVRALGVTMEFITDAGVFSRGKLDAGTRALLEALPPLRGRILDLGCGWGPVGCCMAARWPQAEIALCDINERAVALARANLERNRLRGAAFCGDGLDAVEGQFDLIAVNPPIRAGKALIYGLFDTAHERLRDGGALTIVIRKQQGAPSALKHLQETFGNAEVIAKGGGYWIIRSVKGKEEEA